MKKMINMMGEEEEDLSNTRLDLGLGLGGGDYVARHERAKKTVCLDLSFSLSPKVEPNIVNLDDKAVGGSSSLINLIEEEQEEEHDYSNNKITSCSLNNNERKKLRLSREQSSLLEGTFKLHTTLNPAQKHALAEQLNLKPRQVEVWFQNRRARTKLKQTEVDCEFLKKCCESLSDENRRLKRELQELYIQLPQQPATCTSCQRNRLSNAWFGFSPRLVLGKGKTPIPPCEISPPN
ncbi:homeobox-leucine zipper protein HOX15-like [Tripterygium wilfordii]|uniref:homeobox-leucine zipper protein HOX15-like n=1 Tax=Tripterygium wilfordii TaxID=458696 RepID=UPI0018F7FB24|nr:homeobox-leucine zipper protein HOX15-like [Tripterygium wilfordii]